MLRIRSSILTQVLSSSSVAFPSISSLRRLLSATAATSISPNPSFAVEDYLIDTCGLTRAQALRPPRRSPHLKSSSKPDAVLRFLAGLGVSSAGVAAAVVKDPLFLCAGVERTLDPVFVGLTGLGLSRQDIARLVSLAGSEFRRRSIVSRVQYYLPLFGSFENLLRALKHGSCLLRSDLERVVKPTVTFLQECGLSDCDVAKLCLYVPRMLTANPERVRAMAACAEGLGVPRGSGMFRHALQAVAFLSEKEIAAKVDYLKKTFRWSDAEVSVAVSRSPFMLRRSKESLQLKSDFLISELGLEPACVARLPTITNCSLEGRLRPRYYVVKFLKENGLVEYNRSYPTIFKMSENNFVKKYICPHKEAAPVLADDYAAACTGKLPARSIFS